MKITVILILFFTMFSLFLKSDAKENFEKPVILSENKVYQNVDLDVSLKNVKEPLKPTPEPVKIVNVSIVSSEKIEPPQKWNKEQIENRIREVFGENSESALKIAQCESGIRDNAVNFNDKPYPSVGIYQIMSFPQRGTIETLSDPEFNIQWAYKASSGGTKWSHAWVNCSKKHNLS
jgi:hypothetical protein